MDALQNYLAPTASRLLKPALFSAFCLLAAVSSTMAQAATGNAPSVKSGNTAASAGSQQAAFGVESIKLGGVFGHRIDTMIKGNLFKIDLEKDFLQYFRGHKLKMGFRGNGLMLDAAVHFAAYSQNEELIRWKNHWIDELISTQAPDGYIGLVLPGPNRGAVNFDLSEKGCNLLALVNDYRFFGRQNSLEAARKLGDEFIASFNPAHFGKLWTCEYPLIALSEASGDPKYVDWVRATFFPDGKISTMWTNGLGGWDLRNYGMGSGFGGDPLKPLNMEGLHAYRWCDINVSMLYLNRHYPNPALRAGYPQMIAWIKDGGSLAPGSFVLDEKWRRSQTARTALDHDPEFLKRHITRTKVGENCAKRYVVELLHLAMQERPNPYYGDVMERTIYNGLFAGMSPTGRMLSYDLSVEGTRLANFVDHFCCPGNLRRALGYLPGYFYHQQGNQIYFNLYGESDARLRLSGGKTIRLVQKTDYPASGKIQILVESSKPVEQELLFRVPAWCQNPQVRLNGKSLSGVQSGTFFPLKREWKTGDALELNFPMEWRWMRGIREQEGRAVLARGPIIYSLNPFTSGITNYVDLQVNVDDPWFADHQTASWGHPRVNNKANVIPGYEEHEESMRALEGITLEPSSINGPVADDSVPFGSKVTVKGWLGTPKGVPNRSFVFNSFDHPNGRKIYLKLSDRSIEVDDELFGKEIHEKTVYPARWAAVTNGLNVTEVPDAGLDQALLVKPMRGSYWTETAKGVLAGRDAWMSCSLANAGQRRVEFRVYDPRFSAGACSNVLLSVLYLDKGNCTVSLLYDYGDGKVYTAGKPGAFKPGGDIQIGNSGTIKRIDFNLPDARFGKNMVNEGTDFRLVADKEVDFVILGAFLQPAKK